MVVLRRPRCPHSPCIASPQADGPPLLVCKGALAEMVPLCSSVLRGDEEVLPLDDRLVTAR